MSVKDVVLVATVREEIRGMLPVRVDVADIPRHVEVAQACISNPSMGDVNRDGRNSGSTVQESDSRVAIGPCAELEDAKAVGVGSPAGDEFTASSKVESTEAQEIASADVVTDKKPTKDLGHSTDCPVSIPPRALPPRCPRFVLDHDMMPHHQRLRRKTTTHHWQEISSAKGQLGVELVNIYADQRVH